MDLIGLTGVDGLSIICVIHAIYGAERVDDTPADAACDAGKSIAPFPTAAAIVAETSVSAARR